MWRIGPFGSDPASFCVTESMMGILADGGERSFIISAKPEAVETSDIEDAKTSDAHALPSTLTTMKSRQVRISILYFDET